MQKFGLNNFHLIRNNTRPITRTTPINRTMIYDGVLLHLMVCSWRLAMCLFSKATWGFSPFNLSSSLNSSYLFLVLTSEVWLICWLFLSGIPFGLHKLNTSQFHWTEQWQGFVCTQQVSEHRQLKQYGVRIQIKFTYCFVSFAAFSLPAGFKSTDLVLNDHQHSNSKLKIVF